MKTSVILTLIHATNGLFFRFSGKSKPDSYTFSRVPDQQHLHRLTMTLEEWRKVKNDLLDQPLPMPIDIDFAVEFEDGDADEAAAAPVRAELAQVRGELQQSIDDRDKAIADRAIVEDELAKAGGAGGLTPEQKEMLAHRDLMLELLVEYAEEEEDPLTCLDRVLKELKTLRKAAAKAAKAKGGK